MKRRFSLSNQFIGGNEDDSKMSTMHTREHDDSDDSNDDDGRCCNDSVDCLRNKNNITNISSDSTNGITTTETITTSEPSVLLRHCASLESFQSARDSGCGSSECLLFKLK